MLRLQVGGHPSVTESTPLSLPMSQVGLHGLSSSYAVPAGWKRSLSVDACALGNDTRYINSSRGCPLGPNLTDVEVRSPHQFFLHTLRTCIMPCEHFWLPPPCPAGQVGAMSASALHRAAWQTTCCMLRLHSAACC